MVNNLYGHLDLPMIPDMSSKKPQRGGSLSITSRDHGFTKAQTTKLDKISTSKKLPENTPVTVQPLPLPPTPPQAQSSTDAALT